MRRALTELLYSDEKEYTDSATSRCVRSAESVLYTVDVLDWLTTESERSNIRLNEGFMRQLYVFEQCEYAPTETHPVYIPWKKANDEAAAADAHARFMRFTTIEYDCD